MVRVQNYNSQQQPQETASSQRSDQIGIEIEVERSQESQNSQQKQISAQHIQENVKEQILQEISLHKLEINLDEKQEINQLINQNKKQQHKSLSAVLLSVLSLVVFLVQGILLYKFGEKDNNYSLGVLSVISFALVYSGMISLWKLKLQYDELLYKGMALEKQKLEVENQKQIQQLQPNKQIILEIQNNQSILLNENIISILIGLIFLAISGGILYGCYDNLNKLHQPLRYESQLVFGIVLPLLHSCLLLAKYFIQKEISFKNEIISDMKKQIFCIILSFLLLISHILFKALWSENLWYFDGVLSGVYGILAIVYGISLIVYSIFQIVKQNKNSN